MFVQKLHRLLISGIVLAVSQGCSLRYPAFSNLFRLPVHLEIEAGRQSGHGLTLNYPTFCSGRETVPLFQNQRLHQ